MVCQSNKEKKGRESKVRKVRNNRTAEAVRKTEEAQKEMQVKYYASRKAKKKQREQAEKEEFVADFKRKTPDAVEKEKAATKRTAHTLMSLRTQSL